MSSKSEVEYGRILTQIIDAQDVMDVIVLFNNHWGIFQIKHEL